MQGPAEHAASAGSSMSEWLDELEAELGQRAALRVLANCGGQRRNIPLPQNAAASALAIELGPQIACWIADRFGGGKVEFPSSHARRAGDAAARLRADVLEAGLTDPARSANDIARAHHRSVRRVEQLRQELRAESGREPDVLPLFRDR